jgi:hypothetical protein
VGNMNSSLVLVGFLVMLVCQDIVAIRAFRKSVKEGILCAVIPGYILLYGVREEPRQPMSLIGWLIGLGLLLMGFMR